MNDLWVFGYGSLMWNPGFQHAERRRARLWGYHRAPCVFSINWRGTPDLPGIVMGLAPGGSCCGLAFRVAAADRAATLEYLDGRELITNVYRPISTTLRLDDARTVTALTYVARPDHPQFAGRTPLPELVPYVRQASGIAGPAIDYLANTVAHLDAMGIRKSKVHDLHRLTLAAAAETHG